MSSASESEIGGAGAAGAEGAVKAPAKETVKETLISIIIAFVLAFVFRGFVVEAFVIPTGSMAPTLMGAHMRFRGPESGYSWAVGPWHMIGSSAEPRPLQGASRADRFGPAVPPVVVHDPMTGQRIEASDVMRRAGDRILVLKFLYGIFEPERYDVVVFKCPYDPATNFIKRLVGLPGEEVAVVDGDVFVRSARGARIAAEGEGGAWAGEGWTIARKPDRVQRAVWQPVFDTRFTPLNPMRDGRVWFSTPWRSADAGWKLDGPVYEYSGTGPTTLAWDRSRVRYSDTLRPWHGMTEYWDLDDRYPYDEMPGAAWGVRFPVSDLRVRAGVEAASDGQEVEVVIESRGHLFRAVVSAGTATIGMRGPGSGSESRSGAEWRTLATAALTGNGLAAGRVTDVEFCHVDQSLQLWIDGRRVVSAVYDWTPRERVEYSTGRTLADLLGSESRGSENIFARTGLYRRPEVRWVFRGGPLKLHRVGLDRDLHYRSVERTESGSGFIAAGTATHPGTTPALSLDQYFCLGDNSPASADGRLWNDPDPWVAAEIDPSLGIVPRKLMIGKAFFVYFPSLLRERALPVPDFGRLRFIW